MAVVKELLIDINKLKNKEGSTALWEMSAARFIKMVDEVKKYGIREPIIVTEQEDTYVIIAGIARVQAAKIAGIKKVPAKVVEYNLNNMED